MVTRSRLKKKGSRKKTKRLKRDITFKQISEADYLNKTIDMKKYANVNFYSDVTNLALKGKNDWGIRSGESDASPENRDVDTTKKFSIYTAVVPEMEKDEFGRWVAIASIDGERGIRLHEGKNREELFRKLSFDRTYSQNAPSVLWRKYRFLQGWKE